MNNKEFCRIVTQVEGEEIDNIKQIKLRSFNGEELKEWLEIAIKVMSCCVSQPSRKSKTFTDAEIRKHAFNIEAEQLAIDCNCSWFICEGLDCSLIRCKKGNKQ